MFENVDGLTTNRWTDGRWSDWYTISSLISLWLRWAKKLSEQTMMGKVHSTSGRGFPSGGRHWSSVCCFNSTLTPTGSLSKRFFKSENILWKKNNFQMGWLIRCATMREKAWICCIETTKGQTWDCTSKQSDQRLCYSLHAKYDSSWLSFVMSKRSCHFPIGILGQVWCLIVLIPDLCSLSYLYMGLDARKPVFKVWEQQRRRPACASAHPHKPAHPHSLISAFVIL